MSPTSNYLMSYSLPPIEALLSHPYHYQFIPEQLDPYPCIQSLADGRDHSAQMHPLYLTADAEDSLSVTPGDDASKVTRESHESKNEITVAIAPSPPVCQLAVGEKPAGVSFVGSSLRTSIYRGVTRSVSSICFFVAHVNPVRYLVEICMSMRVRWFF
jgi:hypothetical protein